MCIRDRSYLYRFGDYISGDEETMAAFLNRLPEETIRLMADTFTEGYRKGFEVTGRDLSKKKTAAIRYPVGMERVVRPVSYTHLTSLFRATEPRAERRRI